VAAGEIQRPTCFERHVFFVWKRSQQERPNLRSPDSRLEDQKRRTSTLAEWDAFFLQHETTSQLVDLISAVEGELSYTCGT